MARPKSRGERGEVWYTSGLRFECTQCGQCCSGSSGTVEFSHAEAAGMAKALGLGHQEFLDQFAQRFGAGWILKEVPETDGDGFDCILLARDPETGLTRCTVHRERPTQCRTWPFWPENLKSKRTWRQAGAECEGIGQGPQVSYREIALNRDATPEPGTAYDEPEVDEF